MKRTILALPLVLAAVMPAAAQAPQTPEPLDPTMAMAAIDSMKADLRFQELKWEAIRKQSLEKIRAVRAQCGPPCAEPAPPAEAKPEQPAAPN